MLKSKEEYMLKFHEMAARFLTLCQEKEWGRAAQVYREASNAAFFLEVPREMATELFGYHEDDGTDEQKPQGLFPIHLARKANWECCIRQHKTYQDEALRKPREPAKYFSDWDYCAKCRDASQLPWR